MNIAILTSNQQRHQYFVARIASLFNIGLVVREVKRDVIASAKVTENTSTIMESHLKARDDKEQFYFGTANLPDLPILDVGTGEVNSAHVLEQMRSINPDVVLLYGTSIIKEPLLNLFKDRIINMHLGLSPYYRGAGTNFWPLVNNQPECLGVTIHHAVLAVDAGPILHQVRPEIQPEDGPHDVGCKSIQVGVEGMMRVLQQFKTGQVQGFKQDLTGGLLYKRKDFSAEAVQKMQQNFERDMIPQYLQNKPERDARYPLVQCESSVATI